ncbi:hypothetical protein Nepgr_010207 [Nepenthes gracilis]|uniref:Uncharacterized protein n=1 Tax=Nepenthes gracilis TaxID=150966 RepID=A0AAD3XKU9_NEPGR|nr:hypothetical protein Nepgr_010207 [Nepenthes gracilis]
MDEKLCLLFPKTIVNHDVFHASRQNSLVRGSCIGFVTGGSEHSRWRESAVVATKYIDGGGSGGGGGKGGLPLETATIKTLTQVF